MLEDGEEHTFHIHKVDQSWHGDCPYRILAALTAGTHSESAAKQHSKRRRESRVETQDTPEIYYGMVTD